MLLHTTDSTFELTPLQVERAPLLADVLNESNSGPVTAPFTNKALQAWVDCTGGRVPDKTVGVIVDAIQVPCPCTLFLLLRSASKVSKRQDLARRGALNPDS